MKKYTDTSVKVNVYVQYNIKVTCQDQIVIHRKFIDNSTYSSFTYINKTEN